MSWYTSMMTSSNGNIFRVTGPLCGEFTGTGEFPTQRPVARSFDVFFDLLRINGWVNNREAGDLTRHRGHYDVIVMGNPTGTRKLSPFIVPPVRGFGASHRTHGVIITSLLRQNDVATSFDVITTLLRRVSARLGKYQESILDHLIHCNVLNSAV